MKILTFIAIFINCLGMFAQNDTSYALKIDLSSFESSRRHWYHIYDKNNIIHPRPDQKRYNSSDITNIADNILLFQRSNGGWPKNYDIQAILTNEQKDSLILTKNILHTTFDNSTTFTHIEFLAKAYTQTRNDKYKEACLQGIQFIFSAQYPNGGWPQYFPLEKNYSRHITFNDGAYIGIMEMFKDILEKKPFYSFVDSTTRPTVKIAFEKGLDCILKCQIYDNGRLTAWCQQHNENDYSPVWARAFEPPSICNGESAGIILFLMDLENPSEKVINAVQCAVKWLEDSKIKGVSVDEITIPAEKTERNTITRDKIVVSDSAAPPIWTRYYELKTHRPLFCNRDSKYVYTLAEVSKERRSGYGWYTYNPQKVLDKYPKWQKKWNPQRNVLNEAMKKEVN